LGHLHHPNYVYTNHENVWEIEYVFSIYFMGFKEMFTTVGPNILRKNADVTKK